MVLFWLVVVIVAIVAIVAFLRYLDIIDLAELFCDLLGDLVDLIHFD